MMKSKKHSTYLLHRGESLRRKLSLYEELCYDCNTKILRSKNPEIDRVLYRNNGHTEQYCNAVKEMHQFELNGYTRYELHIDRYRAYGTAISKIDSDEELNYCQVYGLINKIEPIELFLEKSNIKFKIFDVIYNHGATTDRCKYLLIKDNVVLMIKMYAEMLGINQDNIDKHNYRSLVETIRNTIGDQNDV